MGKQSRRLTASKKKKKARIASPVVEIPEFEYSGFNVSTGVKNVALLLKKASPEVQNLILCECRIIYECKSCRLMFRDASQFTNHKLSECQEKQFANSPGPITRSRARSSTSDSGKPEKNVEDSN